MMFNTQVVRLDKKTFVFLRWIANIGQFLTVNFVYFVLNFQFSFVECLFFIFLGFLSNFYLQFIFKGNQLHNFESTTLLFYDLVQLSVLIYLTGGITNPFCILLIVPTIISSTFVSFSSTLILGIFTFLSLLILSFFYLKLPGPENLHLLKSTNFNP